MKEIDFDSLYENNSTNVVDKSKVDASFVQKLKEAFLMFPVSTNMRFKQSPQGKLIISVTVTYTTGMVQHLEGTGDIDLISAIQFGMAKITKKLCDYKAEEHKVEVAQEGKNLVMELFKQYMGSTMRGYIETDWYSKRGERYRCVRFTPTFNGKVTFYMKATEEVNNLICESCKPEWMKESKAIQETPKQNEVA